MKKYIVLKPTVTTDTDKLLINGDKVYAQEGINFYKIYCPKSREYIGSLNRVGIDNYLG